MWEDRAMDPVNLATLEYDFERQLAGSPAPPSHRCGHAVLGEVFGAGQTGASAYRIPPGSRLFPYHYERCVEEWLVVLEGRPTLRTPDGEQELRPMDVVFFPLGPDGGHGIRNAGDTDALVLMFSDQRDPSVTIYPDSDKIAVWTGSGEDQVVAVRPANVDYYHGET
jgi:uncharacterized cupin superfamily protein